MSYKHPSATAAAEGGVVGFADTRHLWWREVHCQRNPANS
jgi:hypothetical protein